MRLTVLGCAGSMPGPDSPASSYLIEADGFHLLLDMGSGSIGPLQRQGLLFEVDAIIISHLHPDHCADLASYLVARKHYPPSNKQLDKIDVHGPAGTADRIAAIAGPGIGESTRDYFNFSTLLPGSLEIGPFQIRLERMNHPVETFASRIEHGGKVFTYSADTGESDNLVKLANKADLFLCEASFQDDPDNPPNLHLSAKQAGELATRAEVSRLLLTHIVTSITDPMDQVIEASKTFSGPVEAALTNCVYEI